MDSLDVKVSIRGTGQLRRASSGCHGALLDTGPGHTPEKPAWLCRECGQPCDRIMSEPEEVELRGGWNLNDDGELDADDAHDEPSE